MLHIAPADPRQPEVAALIAAADAFSMAHYPPESRHPLDLPELARPNVTLFLATLDGRAVACAALIAEPPEHGEIKRMFVADGARGLGLGQALLRRLEAKARRLGLPLLRLEAGTRSPAALALYRNAGFRERAPFGSYAADPLSVFMEKPVAPEPVDFRAVTGRDLDTLLAQARAFHAEEGRAFSARSEAALAAVCAGHPLAAAWLIEAGGAVVGYLVLTRGYGIEYGGPDLFLDELYLVPGARGRGLGRAAMIFVDEQARAVAATAIHLVVAPDNRRAQALYARANYEDAGWRVMSRRL